MTDVLAISLFEFWNRGLVDLFDGIFSADGTLEFFLDAVLDVLFHCHFKQFGAFVNFDSIAAKFF